MDGLRRINGTVQIFREAWRIKQEIRVVVFKDESCEYNLPGNPKEFLAWWEEKFSRVPAEYKETALVECSTDTSYDIIQFGVKVSYSRLETDEEEEARLKREDDRRKFTENQELCQLEKLKAKYGV